MISPQRRGHNPSLFNSIKTNTGYSEIQLKKLRITVLNQLTERKKRFGDPIQRLVDLLSESPEGWNIDSERLIRDIKEGVPEGNAKRVFLNYVSGMVASERLLAATLNKLLQGKKPDKLFVESAIGVFEKSSISLATASKDPETGISKNTAVKERTFLLKGLRFLKALNELL
ncbi:MAG: hypothetical protein ABH821_04475 [archaeon]